jgi:hypothetical protein
VLPLQILDQEISHLGIQVKACIAACYTMIFIGVNKKVKLLVGSYQRGHHIHAVLEVHVVIGASVDQQILPLE